MFRTRIIAPILAIGMALPLVGLTADKVGTYPGANEFSVADPSLDWESRQMEHILSWMSQSDGGSAFDETQWVPTFQRFEKLKELREKHGKDADVATLKGEERELFEANAGEYVISPDATS